MERSRPTWLVEPCPAWCLREHDEDDHPEDREHRGKALCIAVVASGVDTIPATDSLSSLDLVVQLHRQVGEAVEWVSIEPADARHPRLALSRESARSLAQSLQSIAGGEGRDQEELSCP